MTLSDEKNSHYMKKFSLSTLLLLIVIVALSVSQFVMMQQLSSARREVDAVRKNYGHISVDDPTLAYVCGIAKSQNRVPTAARIVVPPGSRYLLHLSDATFDDETPSDSLPPTKTISLNGWRDGADKILTCEVHRDNGVPVVKVRTDEHEFFNYRLEDWTDSGEMHEGSFISNEPRSFTVDETISISTWRDPGTNRGVAIWLEPHARAKQRETAIKKGG